MKLGRKPDPERIRLRIKYGFTEKQAKRASRLFLQLEQCRDDAARRLLLGRGYEKWDSTTHETPSKSQDGASDAAE